MTRDDDRDLVAEIQADLARGKAQINRMLVNCVAITALLLLGAAAWFLVEWLYG